MKARKKGRVTLYHGTNKRNLEKIMKCGFIRPQLADVENYGEGVWFTTDFEEAREYGPYVLELQFSNLKRFKYRKITPIPHEWWKSRKYRSLALQIQKNNPHYTVVVLNKIPMKYIDVTTRRRTKPFG